MGRRCRGRTEGQKLGAAASLQSPVQAELQASVAPTSLHCGRSPHTLHSSSAHPVAITATTPMAAPGQHGGAPRGAGGARGAADAADPEEGGPVPPELPRQRVRKRQLALQGCAPPPAPCRLLPTACFQPSASSCLLPAVGSYCEHRFRQLGSPRHVLRYCLAGQLGVQSVRVDQVAGERLGGSAGARRWGA